MMTTIGILMILFGLGFAVRNFMTDRKVWGVLSLLFALIGAGSLWTDYAVAVHRAEQANLSDQGQNQDAEQEEPVIGDYDPDAAE